jgi:hypothetical protein
MIIDLSSEDVRVLTEALDRYLAEFRREVAGTENPEFRRQLQGQQNDLERMLAKLRRLNIPESSRAPTAQS